ncbi:hypothetical protein [Brevibacterium oceani]|uniref:hypothetical protein n=1 Tax=Brevibacterium oceani TaxID=358099 RepID=UPI0015E6C518|nr:hypothetical protein [Brevibacterium oceani]
MEALRSAGCVFAEEEAAILLESEGNGAGSGKGIGSGVGTGSGGRADSLLEDRVARRVAGEPLEQIVGWVDFAGLKLRTLPGVFVPRQRTRRLAEHTVRVIEQMPRRQAVDGRPGRRGGSGEPCGPSSLSGLGRLGGLGTEAQITQHGTEPWAPVVVEAFCGVGPVGSYVAASVAEMNLHLGDTDAHAVECAVDNARNATGGLPNASDDLPAAASTGHPASFRNSDSPGGVVRGHRLDCLVGLPHELRHSVDVIAAVPPYVPTTAADFLPREAVDFEPGTALFGGVDGLDLVRRLIAEADHWLAADGVLLIELGREQAPEALTYAAAHGLVGSDRLGEGDDNGEEVANGGPHGCCGDHLGEGTVGTDDHLGAGTDGTDDDPDEHTVVLELRRTL